MRQVLEEICCAIWKAHQKTCRTREYKCDSGTIFSRRDSFITHRAFCDALAEENNNVNQGLMNNMGSNLQNQMAPELIPSMPMSKGNVSVGVSDSDFGNFDPNSPLKSLPQELVPMPFMSMNMGGGMFTSSSSSRFSGSRSVSSASSSLQLSSNSASGLNYLQDSKNGCPIMSATALLQKAAQMGATASNSINSPMMQKGFASSMPCPQQQNTSYDHQFAPQTNQSSMVGISPIMSSATNDMGMFINMFINGADHQNQGLMKSLEHEDSLLQGRTQGPAMFGTSSTGGASSNMTTLDFMGIGGSRPNGLHEQWHHQQQRLELEAISQQQRLPMMNLPRNSSHMGIQPLKNPSGKFKSYII
ncbi:putative cation efflux protein/ zinc transporter [Hibiscus syriacus]|uniref:Cation efflux protein/ zinc transporter n=1 Tax=Hibiscus syriacus TaxID=106335 RepID=A0A6A2XEU7_HIBSY|nr:putative cation efflux protein/ zinc transporter [Hibiscus syriacus]